MKRNQPLSALKSPLKAIFTAAFILFGRITVVLSQSDPYQLIVPDLPTKDLKARSVAKVNDKLYFVSEYKFYSVDVQSGTSEEITTSMGSFPYNNEILSVGDKLVLGGTNSNSVGGQPVVFDPNTSEFTVLKIINTSGPSNPQYFYENGGYLYFTAFDGSAYHLWRTDGTSDETIQLSTDAFPNGARYTPLGTSTLVLGKSSGNSYDRLYLTDGTAENTTLIKGFSLDSDPGRFSIQYEDNYLVPGTSIVFVILRSSSREVWYSDGIAANTEMLFSIDNTVAFVDQLAVFENSLFYNKYWSENAVTNSSLMKYDFISEMSSEVTSFDGTRVGEMHATDSYLLFTNDVQMWVTDGTAEGTSLLHQDLVPFGRINEFLTFADGKVVFRGYSSLSGAELWLTDGTVEGTTLIKDIFPGTTSSIPFSQEYPIQIFENDVLYLLTDSPTIGLEFWRSNGASEGTHIIADVNNTLAEPTLADGASNDNYLVAKITGVAESNAFLLEKSSTTFQKIPDIDNGGNLGELFTFNKNIVFYNYSYPKFIYKVNDSGILEKISFLESNNVDNISSLYHIEDKLIFTGSVPTTPPYVEYVTFLSDGSPENTYSIGPFYIGTQPFPESFGMLNENELLLAGGDLFTANTNGVELRKVNIHMGEASLIKDIIPGTGNSNPFSFTKAGNDLFFLTSDEDDEYHVKYLWKSNGTQEGTVLVYDFDQNHGLRTFSVGNNLVILTSDTYGSDEMSIYVSDGTTENTHLLKSIGRHFINSPTPYPLIQGDNYIIYFDNESFNYSIVSINPNLEETVLVSNSQPIKTYWRKDNLIFIITANGTLYRTDGTTSGTVVIDDYFSSFDSNGITGFASFNDLIIVNVKKNSIKEIWAQSIFYSDIEVLQNTAPIVSGASYDLGSAAFDTESATSYSFAIKNNGLINLDFDQVISSGISGNHANDFLVKNASFENRIGPDEEGVLEVYFKPTGTGTRTATLTLNTNDEDTPTFTILLSGQGVKASQSIAFGALAPKAFGVDPFELMASASSGLSVSYSSSDNTILSIEDNVATILKAGTVTITASQAGNDNFEATTPVDQTLAINRATQTVTFDPLPEKTYGDAPLNLSATATSGLNVTFSSSDASVASVEGGTITILKAGAATITASQAGNDNYNATSAEQTLTVAKASQTITFDELPTLQSDDEPIELVAEASSGLPVAFQSEDETIATIDGATLTITGSGTTSITATQAGDDNYLAAEEVVRALVVEEVTGLGNEQEEKVVVYPNPSDEILYISLPSHIATANYQITQLTGQVLKEGQLVKGSSQYQVSVDGFRPGVYLLTVSAPDYRENFRLIKN
jgi:ELWxxDGT repeat protein